MSLEKSITVVVVVNYIPYLCVWHGRNVSMLRPWCTVTPWGYLGLPMDSGRNINDGYRTHKYNSSVL